MGLYVDLAVASQSCIQARDEGFKCRMGMGKLGGLGMIRCILLMQGLEGPINDSVKSTRQVLREMAWNMRDKSV